MFLSESLTINHKNHLEIGGCDTIELATKYKTPLYIMDEKTIRNNCKKFKNALDKYYNGHGDIIYASKAFCSMAICKIIEQEGLGLDVVSGGELYTAIKAGFPMKKIYFHGNNKTLEEIELAVNNNIHRFIVDNKEELILLNQIALQKSKKINICFRIKPGVEAHTHEFIKTGQIDSKFGFSLENGEAFEIIEFAKTLKNIQIVGIHSHIGSQIFDVEPFVLAADIMIDFISDLKNKLNITIKELNLGGGFGIKYLPTHDPKDYEYYIKKISLKVIDACKKNSLEIPFLIFEPGRAIVGSSGITLYKVGNVKNIKGIRKYVSIDGGMTDNPRYALYQAEYDALIANRANAKKNEPVTIAGKCCESGDIIAKDIKMPEILVGDILAIISTGAYNYSMSSNYNRIRRPAVVLVKNGVSRLIVQAETYDDIIKNDIMLDDI